MAALPQSLLLLISTLLAATAVNVATNDKHSASVVRRESQASQQVHLDSSGHMRSLNQEAPNVEAEMQPEHKAANPTECDHQFLAMDEGSDECKGDHAPQEILDEAECIHAAGAFGSEFKKAAAPDFVVNEHSIAKWPAPKGCYLNTSSKTVMFNPTGSNTSDITLEGKKICMRTLYVNGTEGSNPEDGCADGTKPILTYDHCLDASLCSAGGGACKILEFQNNVTTYKRDDRPLGCFKDHIGCWGFNYADKAPSGGNLNGTPVCMEIVAVTNKAIKGKDKGKPGKK